MKKKFAEWTILDFDFNLKSTIDILNDWLEERLELMKTMELLLNKVNKVTVPFRHGQKIDYESKAILANYQIEAEQILIKYKPTQK